MLVALLAIHFGYTLLPKLIAIPTCPGVGVRRLASLRTLFCSCAVRASTFGGCGVFFVLRFNVFVLLHILVVWSRSIHGVARSAHCIALTRLWQRLVRSVIMQCSVSLRLWLPDGCCFLGAKMWGYCPDPTTQSFVISSVTPL